MASSISVDLTERPSKAPILVRTWGGLEVETPAGNVRNFGSHIGRSLLARLAARPGAVAREELIRMLWPQDPVETARPRLRTEIHRLRSALGSAAAILKVDRDWLSLDREAAEVDLERLVSSQDTLDGLVRGSWLPEEGGPWFVTRRAEIEDQALASFETSARAALSAGDSAEGLAIVRRCLALLPERSGVVRIGMECLIALNDVPGALALYDRYSDGLEYEVDRRLANFAAELRPKRSAEPAEAVVESSLPARHAELFGREDLIEQLVDTLRASGGVLTLVGPGGVGKTSVALEAARRMEEELQGCVAFVPLASVTDAPGLQAAVARFAPSVTSGESLDLERRFRGQRRLLVLDNFEQLPPEASRWLSEFARRLPQLRILVTSRRSVGIEAERCVSMRPFGMAVTQGPLAAVRAGPTVSLFVDRMRRLVPEFAPDEREVRAIAEIGNRLDGLPLAIVLVAARAASLGVRTVLKELEGLAGLSATTHDLEERHRDLAATMDWSIRLLSPLAREVLPQLTVFPRGCSAEGAADVLGRDALVALPELVDQSLIVAETGPRGTRYRMFRLLREHLLRQFGPPSDALRDRHADFCVRFVEATKEHGNERMEEFLPAVQTELANLDAALEWVRGRDQDRYERLLIGMSSYWVPTMHEDRAADWVFEAARKAEPRGDQTAASLFQRAARLLTISGRYEEAEECLRSAEAIYKSLGSTEGRFETLFAQLQIAYFHRADYRAMAEYAEKGLLIADAAGRRHEAARFSANQAIGLTNIGEGERALRLARRAIDTHRELGALHAELLSWRMYAGTLLALRRWEDAEPVYYETMRRGIEAGLEDMEPHCRLHLTTVYLRTGRFAQARESLDRFFESDIAQKSAFTGGVGHYLGALLGNLQRDLRLSARSLDGLFTAWSSATSQPTILPAVDLVAWSLGIYGFEAEGRRLLDESDALRDAQGIGLSPHFSLTYEDARSTLGPREEVTPPESIEALYGRARKALWLL